MASPIPENRAAFELAEVAAITSGRAQRAGELRFAGVTTDTRGDVRGKLFVALRGDNFDGHAFIPRALDAGAAAVLAEELPEGVPGVAVASTTDALGELAAAHRLRWGKRIVAVAGSAGKTTTRSTTAALLRPVLGERLHAASGNLNNRIGVPMVLLGLTEEHEVGVLELGTNQPGEIPTLTRICAPDVAVLTLIELEHTEALGDLDSIEREESAVLDARAALWVGNGDDPRVRRRVEHRSRGRLSYGFDAACDYRVIAAQIERDARTRIELLRPDHTRVELSSPLLGRPGALACAAALAVAEHVAERRFGPAWITTALAQPGAREPGRLQPIELGDGGLVIDDAYNASPVSMRAAIETAREIADLRGARLHLVLGEMRELGSCAAREHERLRAAITAARPDTLLAIGGGARAFVEAPSQFHEISASAAEALLPLVRPGDVVLVKASRGVRAELVVQALLRERGRPA